MEDECESKGEGKARKVGLSAQNLTPNLTMHCGNGFSLDQRQVDQGADRQGFDYEGHGVLMWRK